MSSLNSNAENYHNRLPKLFAINLTKIKGSRRIESNNKAEGLSSNNF
jgi:hypothetical protein